MKKLKAQLEQKTQKNGTENGSSPDGDILENSTDPNIMELQSTKAQRRKCTTSTSFLTAEGCFCSVSQEIQTG